MNHYHIHLDSDDSELGIQSLHASVDAQTYGVIRDFLCGKITLTVGPLPGSVPEDQPAVSPSGSTE